MWHFKNILDSAFCILILMTGCSSNPKVFPLKAESYIITAEEDAGSEKWAAYLYNHLSKRTGNKAIVALQKGAAGKNVPESKKAIHIELAADLKHDYCIEHTKNRIHLRMKNREIATWIIYELIAGISEEDPRITADDLPPSGIDFSSKCCNFDFVYRDPHFSPNVQKEYAAIAGNNNVETDWGLWGHNLSKIVKDAETESIYALINNQRNKAQLSFTSNELFTLVSDYIVDNYGEGSEKGYRFMIMPNDNDLVCTCPACTAKGNTEKNATPAVNDFVRKLAERFPKHEFYITVYRTVQNPPSFQMAENIGVFLSTVTLPKGTKPNENQTATKEFLTLLKAWKKKTSHIFLWDYAANFDDYLSPMPLLYGVQKQLKFYKKHGVKGVFFNASGYDYMPFDDVKTYVLGALMKNTDVNVESLVRKFFKKKYPVSSTLLTDYYLKLEKDFSEKNKPYNMYGGFDDNLKTYLDTEAFKKLYKKMKVALAKTSGDENEKLKKLYTALSFTKLQLLYSDGADEIKKYKKSQLETLFQNLKNYEKYPDLQRYKETGGELSVYLSEWEHLLKKLGKDNLLKGTRITILSKPDEGFEKTEILNDGIFGFASDYHQGWYLSSTDDLWLSFSGDKIQNARTIKLRFLNNKDHCFFAPEKIEIVADGKVIRSISESEMTRKYFLLECTVNITFAGKKTIEIKCYRKQENKSLMATDEILILK